MYSVRPSTTPRTTALMISSMGARGACGKVNEWLTPCGFGPCAVSWQLSSAPFRVFRDWGHRESGHRLDDVALRISIPLRRDSTPARKTVGRALRQADADAVSPRILPAIPIRAPRARRIRDHAAAGRGAAVGTPPRVPRAQSGRNPAGPA